MRVVSVVVSPTLIALAIALLLRRHQPTAQAAPWIFASLAIVGAACVLLFSLGFSAGMNDADAGRPAGFLSRLALPAAGVGVISVGGAVGVLVSTVLEKTNRMSRPVRLVVSAAAGAVAGIPGFLLQVNPSSSAWVSFALLTALTVMMASKSRLRTMGSKDSLPAGPSVPKSFPEPAVSTVRWMGVLCLVILAMVWAVGATVGISAAGTPAATTAMGLSAGAAQLSAIPIFIAMAAIAHTRAPRLPWRRLSAIPVIGILAGTGVQLAGSGPDGSALFAGTSIAGLSIGAWIALSLLPAMAHGWPTRVATSVALTIGGAFTWFMSVPATGAVALAIPAAILIFAGRTLVVGQSPQVKIP